MQTATVTLSSQGQISIPAKMRQTLGLKPHTHITITLDETAGNLQLARLKTLDEQLAELHASFSPETKARIKQNAGKTASELRAEWDNSPEGQKYYQEKYFSHDN